MISILPTNPSPTISPCKCPSSVEQQATLSPLKKASVMIAINKITSSAAFRSITTTSSSSSSDCTSPKNNSSPKNNRRLRHSSSSSLSSFGSFMGFTSSDKKKQRCSHQEPAENNIKRVRFEENPTVHTVPRQTEMSPKEDLWYSQGDFLRRKQADADLWRQHTSSATHSSNDHDSHVEHFMKSYDELYFAVCFGNKEQLLDSQLGRIEDNIGTKDLSEVLKGFEHGLRGMEKFSEAGRHRRMHVSNTTTKILLRASMLLPAQGEQAQGADADLAAEELRQYASNLTKDCRAWAAIMGKADSLVCDSTSCENSGEATMPSTTIVL